MVFLVLVVFILVGGGIVYLKKRKSTSDEKSIPGINTPLHVLLKKDVQLKTKLDSFADDTATLTEEFKQIENIAKTAINDSMKDAKEENNIQHNRYKDIGRIPNMI